MTKATIDIQKLKDDITRGKRYLNEREVAMITGLSVSMLQKMRMHCMGLPYVKIGKSVRYRLEDIQAFMEAHRVNVTPYYE